MAGDISQFVFYHYDPSLAAAILFIVLFFASTSYHIFQLVRKSTWYFIPFAVGGIFEVIGYVGRVASSTQSPDWTLGPYIIQSLFLLLAPALFAASIYMVLGRIIRLTDGESRSLIRAKWLTKMFVTGDIISFLTQSAGGGVLATANDQAGNDLGQNLIVAGLFLQLFFFGFFIVVCGIFHWRITRNPTARSKGLPLPWQRHILVLYAASTLIMIRSIFRVIEYLQGYDGYLLTREVFLYVFDATLMFFAMLLFNVWHPGSIITKESLASGSETPDSLEKGISMLSKNERVTRKG